MSFCAPDMANGKIMGDLSGAWPRHEWAQIASSRPTPKSSRLERCECASAKQSTATRFCLCFVLGCGHTATYPCLIILMCGRIEPPQTAAMLAHSFWLYLRPGILRTSWAPEQLIPCPKHCWFKLALQAWQHPHVPNSKPQTREPVHRKKMES